MVGLRKRNIIADRSFGLLSVDCHRRLSGNSISSCIKVKRQRQLRHIQQDVEAQIGVFERQFTDSRLDPRSGDCDPMRVD